ncbi:MAG: 23S rRNA (adenine(2503)-C(2))-methyltransferase RlmN [Defluviitaleaceae bacterium]|nr:23S rRNA (adenine(2503)-C(2))-methyltransferase RlmN [Defluviitaleaceae bacterium]
MKLKNDILSKTPLEIAELMAELGQPKYRADQIFEWLHRRNATSFDEMENLPKSLRKELERVCKIQNISEVEKLISKNDGTTKFLTAFDNDVLVESVLMSYRHGASVCISTQAGCKMGCKFCVSTEEGFQRNLTAGEYCAQVYNAAKESPNGKLSGIVLMGCGEPLDNLDATTRFLELISHPKGLNIGQRHITISTCGLVPQIYELAEQQLQITLAISLHAPSDEIRKTIMPIAKKYPMKELIQSCKYYTEKTRRRLTFEYALAKGLNDSTNHAKALAKLLKGLLCHVNLIPINKARDKFHPTPRREIEAFAQTLQDNNINATIRRSLGGDIDAACGQLRARHI